MADKRSKVVLGLFLVSAVVVLALSLYTGFALNALVDSLEQNRNQRLLAEAQATSLIVSADELNAIQSTDDLVSEQSAAIQRRLNAFAALHNLTDITFIRQLPTGELSYIISSSTGAGTYDISAAPFASYELIEQAFGGSIVVTSLHDSAAHDTNLMSFSPVYSADGTVVAVAAVGIDDSAIIKTDTMIRDLTIILLVCIAIVILAACANVLLQVRKEHELQESVRVQNLMIEISQSLASEQPFDERLGATLDSMGSYLGAQRAFIVDLSKKELGQALRHYWSSNGEEPPKGEHGAHLLELLHASFDAKRTKKPTTLFSPNVKQAKNEDYARVREADTEAFIWAPLTVQGELWGVLVLDFAKAQGQFHEKDIQLVESTASDLVGAITRELYSEQREHALDHAVHASEAKSEFLSNMSHEMRTPMNAIIGMTSIALDSEDASRKDYCLEHIKDASAHLLTIINDVLDMSSLQSNELSLKHKPFDLRRMLNDVVRDYIHNIREHNQIFTLEVDDCIPATLVGDKQRLAKIVGNLLSNATKFTPDEGTIALRVKRFDATEGGHCLLFEVQDSGIGLDRTMRDNLFGSFEQADSGSNRKYGGTGLGLAISRRLIELMGGQIGVDSVVNEGSTFYFTITLEEDTSAILEQSSLEFDALSATPHAEEQVGKQATSPASGAALSEESNGFEGAAGSTHEKPTSSESTDDFLLDNNDPAERRKTPDLSGYRILLAEDIEINREVVLALLADSGIQIDITTNGLEVLEAIDSNPGGYDLIFMDLQMPEMDGLDATRRIRALAHPEIEGLPIIAMTANVSQDDIDACVEAGMNDHIGKPVDLDEIYRMLETYLPHKDQE